MTEEHNTIESEVIENPYTGEEENLIIKINKNGFDEEISFLTKDFDSEKHLIGFVKNVERLVRSSIEYKRYIGFIRENLGFNRCLVLNKVDSESATIEMHHHPFTLFDIVMAVVEKYRSNGDVFDTYIIAHEVMSLHYSNVIGVVPLSKTAHELAHSGSVTIPKEYVVGNYQLFYESYKDYLSDSANESYNGWLSSCSLLTNGQTLQVGASLIDPELAENMIENAESINRKSLEALGVEENDLRLSDS
jgi:hypothetical protein